MAAPKKIANAQWEKAIREAGGIVQIISAILGVNRKTVQSKLKNNEWAREVMEETLQETGDLAESCIHAAMKGGNTKVAMWYLERKHKDRGFGKEIKVDSNAEKVTNVSIVLPDNGRSQEPQ
jgi:hypothetical protein